MILSSNGMNLLLAKKVSRFFILEKFSKSYPFKGDYKLERKALTVTLSDVPPATFDQLTRAGFHINIKNYRFFTKEQIEQFKEGSICFKMMKKVILRR